MRRFTVPAIIVFLLSCEPANDSVPPFIEQLPELGRASAMQDSAMRTFARDLEAWSVRAGRPTSAEALIGPLFLRVSDMHTEPTATDTSVDAGYQRLEVRFARMLHTRDSVHTAVRVARDSLTAFLKTHGVQAASRTDSVFSPIFPPELDDSTRAALRLGMKCALITITVLPSKEGVRICVLTFKTCTSRPGTGWVTTCAHSCFDYIGWVPERGDFSIP